MHVRGKAFEYRAVYPDGRTETLLRVPKYDFFWQLDYKLAQAAEASAGSEDRVYGVVRQLAEQSRTIRIRRRR